MIICGGKKPTIQEKKIFKIIYKLDLHITNEFKTLIKITNIVIFASSNNLWPLLYANCWFGVLRYEVG
jgi:hypothetical protein